MESDNTSLNNNTDNINNDTIIKSDNIDEALDLEKYDFGEFISPTQTSSNTSQIPVSTQDLAGAGTLNSSAQADFYAKTTESYTANNLESPFSEIFETKDIVNRTKPSDYILQDDLKAKQEQEKLKKSKQHFYISKKELDLLIKENPRMQMFKKDATDKLIDVDAENIVQNLLNNFNATNEGELIEFIVPVDLEKAQSPSASASPLQPSQAPDESEDTDDGYFHNSNFGNNDEETYYMSEEELEAKKQRERMESTLRVVQDVIDKLSEEEKYVEPDILFKEFLQENFKDFILAKKISGNSKVKYTDKIVSKENIKDDSRKIEISDLHKSLVTTKEKTSVLINRDNEQNIESIEVLCKCGEKTVIKFIEQDDINDEDEENPRVINNSYTDIVVDTVKVLPLLPTPEDEFENFEMDLSPEELEKLQKMAGETEEELQNDIL